MEAKIKEITFFLLDMDGTIYLGDQLIEGAGELLQTLEEQGKRAVFLTNNSSKNREAYRVKLKNMGVKVKPEDIFTSGEATAIYLNKIYPGAKIYLLGTPMLEEEFASAGFKLDFAGKPDFVVLGFDTTLTYQKLWRACDYIREGVAFIATHPDINCPVEGGKYMPDAGAMIKLIEASTGVSPLVIGKPNRHMIDSVCEKYGTGKENMAIVGDRLYTDIQLGINARIYSILVLSGETTPGQYKASDPKASLVYLSVKGLWQALKE
ncbi:MAG: HAD-IIA family hydrolase [Bacillota bacterium]